MLSVLLSVDVRVEASLRQPDTATPLQAERPRKAKPPPPRPTDLLKLAKERTRTWTVLYSESAHFAVVLSRDVFYASRFERRVAHVLSIRLSNTNRHLRIMTNDDNNNV